MFPLFKFVTLEIAFNSLKNHTLPRANFFKLTGGSFPFPFLRSLLPRPLIPQLNCPCFFSTKVYLKGLKFLLPDTCYKPQTNSWEFVFVSLFSYQK